jgi:hypothetical protein
MATEAILGAKMEQAHERALEVVRKHATEEAEDLDAVFGRAPNQRNPLSVASYQAGLIAAQAEIVAELVGTVHEQGRRIAKLEEAAAAKAAQDAPTEAKASTGKAASKKSAPRRAK